MLCMVQRSPSGRMNNRVPASPGAAIGFWLLTGREEGREPGSLLILGGGRGGGTRPPAVSAKHLGRWRGEPGQELPSVCLQAPAKSSPVPGFPTLIFLGINAASNDQLNQIGQVPQAPKSRLIPGTRLAHSLHCAPQGGSVRSEPTPKPCGSPEVLARPRGPAVCHQLICSAAVFL